MPLSSAPRPRAAAARGHALALLRTDASRPACFRLRRRTAVRAGWNRPESFCIQPFAGQACQKTRGLPTPSPRLAPTGIGGGRCGETAVLILTGRCRTRRRTQKLFYAPHSGRRSHPTRPPTSSSSSRLDYERPAIPASLQRLFVPWFAQAGQCGQSNATNGNQPPNDRLRVMTLPRAPKGFEAPIVILADTTTSPARTGGAPSRSLLPLAATTP